MPPNVAIVGATGAVGQEFLTVLSAGTTPCTSLQISYLYGDATPTKTVTRTLTANTRATLHVNDAGEAGPGHPVSIHMTCAGTFLADFRSAYGHVPTAQAIFGYEAMSALLAVLREAGSSANNRTTVLHDFFGINNRSSPLGTYSIDSSGDPTLVQYGIYKIADGRLVFANSVTVPRLA